MAQILAVRSSDTALNLGLNLSQVCHSGPTTAQLLWMIGYSPTGNPDVRRPLSFWWTTMNVISKASYFHIPFTEKKKTLFLGKNKKQKILSRRELNNFPWRRIQSSRYCSNTEKRLWIHIHINFPVLVMFNSVETWISFTLCATISDSDSSSLQTQIRMCFPPRDHGTTEGRFCCKFAILRTLHLLNAHISSPVSCACSVVAFF